ncbi:MAG: hypothetical protein IK125_02370 [Lachnospiraceae bacterium]|nr:hypothetical protein [Lachnospiraceae bacterium]
MKRRIRVKNRISEIGFCASPRAFSRQAVADAIKKTPDIDAEPARLR